MNYQSLYRRFRPQRFGDVIGQDHISNTLRSAVENNRVAHAYLFSGPRGCGKTTSARILAKALNCTNLQGGEPCCECDSCLQVTSGASMDVIEMDAASNNGVDAMRELVSRAALGTSGRRKVYIVDEVHMLSTAASNALLKTLEEPPDHVVFVLATTDPQKVLPTIRSRTQPFEFRLFTFPVLLDLVRGVAKEAEIDLPDETLQAVTRKGNGSARDALSALDQAAAAGGIDDSFDVSELVSALGSMNSEAVLIGVDRAIERGRDPRQLARDVVDMLRNVFLVHMGRPAPVDAALVRALGPAAATRGVETIGEALVAMRDAVEPRIVLEVALLRLVRPDIDKTVAALQQRVEALEARGFTPGPAPSAPAPSAPAAAPAATAEGSVTSEPAPTAATGTVATAAATAPPTTPASPATAPSPAPAAAPAATKSLPQLRANPSTADAPAQKRAGAADAARAQLAARNTPSAQRPRLGAGPDAPLPEEPATPAAGPTPAAPAQQRTNPHPAAVNPVDGELKIEANVASLNNGLEALIEGLSPRPRALFRVGQFTGVSDTTVTMSVPNAAHLERAQEVQAELAAALSVHLGPINLVLHTEDTTPPLGAVTETPRAHLSVVPDPAPLSDDDDVDLSELTDAPDDLASSALDQITAAFPGTELVE